MLINFSNWVTPYFTLEVTGGLAQIEFQHYLTGQELYYDDYSFIYEFYGEAVVSFAGVSRYDSKFGPVNPDLSISFDVNVQTDRRYTGSYRIEDYVTLDTFTYNFAFIMMSSKRAYTGTGTNDMVVGSDHADTIYGGAGNDGLYGGAGDDFIFGGKGVDYIYGGAGEDHIKVDHGLSIVHGGSGIDVLDFSGLTAPSNHEGYRLQVDMAGGEAIGPQGSSFLFASIEAVDGTNGHDSIRGDSASNWIFGGFGDDLFIGSGGSDYYDGGSGKDTVSYEKASAGVALSLTARLGSAGQARYDIYTNIENVIGSRYDDRISGDSGKNILRGFVGDDKVYGGRGDDWMDGGAGRDYLYGGDGRDRILGGAGNDYLFGGAGVDTALYEGNKASYKVSALSDGRYKVHHLWGGSHGIDILDGIEVIQFRDASMSLA